VRPPKKKAATRGKKCNESLWERKTNLILKTSSDYHVMNSTCIHLKAKVMNIYMYMRARIYKEPPEKIQ
jgi:hypothetical protein